MVIPIQNYVHCPNMEEQNEAPYSGSRYGSFCIVIVLLLILLGFLL